MEAIVEYKLSSEQFNSYYKQNMLDACFLELTHRTAKIFLSQLWPNGSAFQVKAPDRPQYSSSVERFEDIFDVNYVKIERREHHAMLMCFLKAESKSSKTDLTLMYRIKWRQRHPC